MDIITYSVNIETYGTSGDHIGYVVIELDTLRYILPEMARILDSIHHTDLHLIGVF